MTMHGCNLESVYNVIDMDLLPEEYLPDEYTGPCPGTCEQINGQASNINTSIKEYRL